MVINLLPTKKENKILLRDKAVKLLLLSLCLTWVIFLFWRMFLLTAISAMEKENQNLQQQYLVLEKNSKDLEIKSRQCSELKKAYQDMFLTGQESNLFVRLLKILDDIPREISLNQIRQTKHFILLIGSATGDHAISVFKNKLSKALGFPVKLSTQSSQVNQLRSRFEMIIIERRKK